mgnify:FL=1
MQIGNTKIEDIKPYPRNAKKHPKKQIEQIANSISMFGFAQPIVLDKNNVIIVGHGRYEAAKLLQLKDVPTITVKLSEDEAKAYRLADNKLNESDWEMEMVIEQLKELSLPLLDVTGLEIKEDDLKVTVPQKPRSHHGDVYELGHHRVVCGDSTKIEDYRKLLGNEKARLVFTDPPYSIDYESTVGTSGNKHGFGYESEKFGGSGKIFNDNKSPEEALKFYKDILKCIYQVTTDDMTLYWWFASRHYAINEQAFVSNNFHVSQMAFWLKNSMVFAYGQLYHRTYEPCLVGWKEKQKHFTNGVFTNMTDLWTLDKKTFSDHLDVWYNHRDPVNKYVHPTQKPVGLAERALKRSSLKGDIVLDAFGGSGSTLIACHQIDRRCYMMELDPKYVDVIVQRYVDYAENPEVIKNGRTDSWKKTKVDEEDEHQPHGGSLKRRKKRTESTDDDEPI